MKGKASIASNSLSLILWVTPSAGWSLQMKSIKRKCWSVQCIATQRNAMYAVSGGISKYLTLWNACATKVILCGRKCHWGNNLSHGTLCAVYSGLARISFSENKHDLADESLYPSASLQQYQNTLGPLGPSVE